MAIPTQLIRYAMDDKYPYHWGALMTIAVVTARLRQCERGDRAQYVDLLSELREADGHAFAVLSKRFAKVSSAKWGLVPAATESESNKAAAEAIAGVVEARIKAIHRWKSHVHGLCWANYTGASCREIMWRRDDAGVHVDSLKLVHSRRIEFTDDFAPIIRDGGTMSQKLATADYPGKFILNVPTMADEHPNRVGLGRELAYWMAFKRTDNRGALDYIGRFGSPFPMAKWRTNRGKDGVATEEEIDRAKELIRAISRGDQPGWAGPDTVDFSLAGPGGLSSSGGSGENTPHKWHIELCNTEISKVVAGGDLNTESQTTGSRALGESQSSDAVPLHVDDAGQLDETITRDLVFWLVAYNFGADAARRFCPKYHTFVEPKEDISSAAAVIDTAVNKLGMRIPTAYAHQRLALPQAKDDEEALKSASGQTTEAAPLSDDAAEENTEMGDEPTE